MKKNDFEQLSLFDLTQWKKETEFTTQEKINWYIAFKKWAEEKWKSEGSRDGIFCCGYMKLCNLCNNKFSNGCKDCIESVKEWYKINNKKIDYKDYNFEKIIENIEK